MTSLRRFALLVTAIVLGCGVEIWSGGPSVALDSPRCAVALALVDQGKPETAAALVDKVRRDAKDQTLCGDAATAAATAINRARTILTSSEADAEALENPPTDKDKAAWKQIKAEAKQAEALDAENPDAAALEKRAADALDTIEPDDWWSRLLQHGKAWKDLAKDHADEWGTLIAAAIGTAALIVFAARLLLLLPQRRHRPPQLRPRKKGGVAETLTAVSVTAAAVATAVGLPSTLETADIPWMVFLTGLNLAALFFTWCWLYHRQRVVIEMLDKGSPSTAGATAVVAHLRRLGASPPKGVEIPLGADAQILEASNITAGGLAGKFVRLLQTALAVTPWRVRIDMEPRTTTSRSSSPGTVVPSRARGRDVARDPELRLRPRLRERRVPPVTSSPASSTRRLAPTPPRRSPRRFRSST